MVMRWMVVVLSAASLGGCATMTRGTTDQVQFESMPAGAVARTAFLDEGPLSSAADENQPTRPGPACVTPCVLSLPRNTAVRVTFSKDGYAPEVLKLKPSPSSGGAAGVAGNILLGGVVGLLADSATGAGFDLLPNPASVVLRPMARR